MTHVKGFAARLFTATAPARAACAIMLLLWACAPAARADDGAAGASNLSDAAPRWLVVQLRSFVPGASGRVVVEPTEAGGRVRLRATRVPAPSAVVPGARAFVVWASGGRVERLGELRRDTRGNAALEFTHPAEFTHYSLIVTAEADALSERPSGAPVFSTRAGEVSSVYPVRREDDRAVSRTAARADERRDERGNARGAAAVRGRTVARAGAERVEAPKSSAETSAAAATTAPRDTAGFYESVDEAVSDSSSARTLEMVGEDRARGARADALVAARGGTAYVRVRFRRVPPPTRYGVRKYVMWAETPDDGVLFLRALPARRLNRRTIYARRRNVGATEFNLAVTAERSYPAAHPRGRRVLTTVGGRGGK